MFSVKISQKQQPTSGKQYLLRLSVD